MVARLRARALTPRVQERLLEIFPGALTWTILLTPIAVAFAIRVYDPTKLWILGAGAILLDLYWLFRTTVTVRAVRRSLHEIVRTENTDWWQRCMELDLPPEAPRPDQGVPCALVPTYPENAEVRHATAPPL